MLLNRRRLAIIGAGPATVYLLHYLSTLDTSLYSITVFEQQADAGRGLPYCQANSSFSLLSNLVPAEIPGTTKSFSEWCKDNQIQLNGQPVPRYLIGQFLHWSLHCSITRCADVSLKSACKIEQIKANDDESFSLLTSSNKWLQFDDIVVNTGHGIVAHETDIQYAYPLDKLELGENVRSVNLIGSSMTAIDCALYVAQRYGSFTDGEQNYVPHRSIQISMNSKSGQLPLPYFESRDFQTEISELIHEQYVVPTGPLSLDVIYQTVLLPLLSKHTPTIYRQCKSHTIRDFISTWQRSIFRNSAETTLKLGLFLCEKNREFPVLLAIFESFFDSLCELNIALSSRDEKFITSICLPFLAKMNGALPVASTRKIFALIKAGVLSINAGFDAASLKPSRAEDTVTIDCRAAGRNENDPFTNALIQSRLVRVNKIAHNTSQRPLIKTDSQLRAFISPNTQSTIYIGSAPLLEATSKTLPGLSVTDNLAYHIAQSLAGSIHQACA